MIDLSQARLTTLAVHKVGNKAKNQGVVASKELFPLEEDLTVDILQDYFLKPFKAEEFFMFAHPSDLAMNEMYTYCKMLFERPREEFLEHSYNILHHLYNQSTHPQIKPGELCVAHFRECTVGGTELEAIGIFKAENKDTFLRVEQGDEKVNLKPEQGINTRKLDKGCLVFNTFAEEGYSVLMVDKDSEDSRYWRDEFLQVVRIMDDSYHTSSFMNLGKEFCEEVFSREQDKKDQLVFLNKMVNYFSGNEEFDMEDFKKEVIVQPEYQEQFDDYRKVYEEEQGLSADEGFAISKYAVRSMKKFFKNIIKLDTQMEIRLQSKDLEETSQYLEKGFDEQRGMYFYKMYFNEEEE